MQQQTTNLSVNHPVKSMMGLARQIALPHEYAPVRFPSFPALERTAVMGFSNPSSLPLAASGEYKLLLFRQAAYPAWADQTLTASLAIYSTTYLGCASATANQTNAQYIMDGYVFAMNSGSSTATVNTSGFSGTTFPTPHPILGLDSGTGSGTWTYIPPGCAWYISAGTTNAATTTTTFTVEYEVWSSPGEVSLQISALGTIATGNLSGAVGIAGTFLSNRTWIRPKVLNIASAVATTSATIGTVNIVVCPGTAVFTPSATDFGTFGTPSAFTGALLLPLVGPSEFQNSQLPWFSTRTTAVSLLGTNVTQLLNKGGTVLAGRCSPNVQDPWRITSSYVNSLHPAEKAFLPLETGIYTYCPPSTDLADFYDYTSPRGFGSTALPVPVFRLDNSALYNVMFLNSPGVAESMAITVDWHIEFRTSSALFQIGLSTMTLESLHAAQLALAKVGFFFENPDHKSILSKVVAAAKYMSPLLGLVHPVVGQAVNSVLELTRRPASSNHVKTTSLKGSGLVPGKVKSTTPIPKKKKARGVKARGKRMA